MMRGIHSLEIAVVKPLMLAICIRQKTPSPTICTANIPRESESLVASFMVILTFY